MKRLIPMSIAAASVLALAAGAARAEGSRDREGGQPYSHSAEGRHGRRDRDDRDDYRYRRVARSDRDSDRARSYRDLQERRARFYASWDGDWHVRVEFERWYADQCARLGYAP